MLIGHLSRRSGSENRLPRKSCSCYWGFGRAVEEHVGLIRAVLLSQIICVRRNQAHNQYSESSKPFQASTRQRSAGIAQLAYITSKVTSRIKHQEKQNQRADTRLDCLSADQRAGWRASLLHPVPLSSPGGTHLGRHPEELLSGPAVFPHPGCVPRPHPAQPPQHPLAQVFTRALELSVERGDVSMDSEKEA